MKRRPFAGVSQGYQEGQTALLFALLLLVFFMLFALALDAGFWYFDHRWAQNQAEAAALAGAYRLPSTDPGPAQSAAINYLANNGWASFFGEIQATAVPCGSSTSLSGALALVEVMDCRANDGRYDTVRVRVRRQTLTFLSGLFGVPVAYVSASATAQAGSAGGANVMPWAVVPPCARENTENNCDESYGYGFESNLLYSFRCVEASCDPSTYTPGNFGAIDSCGQGTTNYRDCITGEASSGFFFVGEEVYVEVQTGTQGQNTNSALVDLVTSHGEMLVNGSYTCDVQAWPDSSGKDSDGKEELMTTRVVTDSVGQWTIQDQCAHRAVLVPFIQRFPSRGSSEPVRVLGLGVFYIAGWDRDGPWGDAANWKIYYNDNDNRTEETGCVSKKPNPPPGGRVEKIWDCGMVWGYLLEGVNPADRFNLVRLSDKENPYAPIMVVLID